MSCGETQDEGQEKIHIDLSESNQNRQEIFEKLPEIEVILAIYSDNINFNLYYHPPVKVWGVEKFKEYYTLECKKIQSISSESLHPHLVKDYSGKENGGDPQSIQAKLKPFVDIKFILRPDYYENLTTALEFSILNASYSKDFPEFVAELESILKNECSILIGEQAIYNLIEIIRGYLYNKVLKTTINELNKKDLHTQMLENQQIEHEKQERKIKNIELQKLQNIARKRALDNNFNEENVMHKKAEKSVSFEKQSSSGQKQQPKNYELVTFQNNNSYFHGKLNYRSQTYDVFNSFDISNGTPVWIIRFFNLPIGIQVPTNLNENHFTNLLHYLDFREIKEENGNNCSQIEAVLSFGHLTNLNIKPIYTSESYEIMTETEIHENLTLQKMAYRIIIMEEALNKKGLTLASNILIFVSDSDPGQIYISGHQKIADIQANSNESMKTLFNYSLVTYLCQIQNDIVETDNLLNQPCSEKLKYFCKHPTLPLYLREFIKFIWQSNPEIDELLEHQFVKQHDNNRFSKKLTKTQLRRQ